MKTLWNNYRYLIARRFVQISVMVLYFSANAWGWTVLTGNLSSSSILGVVPLSDPYAALQMLAAGAIMATDLIIGALIITVIYGLIGGRMFCSWVCPVNPITDAANFLRRKLNFNQIQKKQPANKNIRYWVIILSLIISFALGVTAFEFISPISMIHRGIIFGFGFGWAAILIIFLFDLFVLKHGWCGHICPLGATYSIIGKFSLLKVDHNVDNCTECMKCKDVCPEVQVLGMIAKNSEQVLNSECTNCARCIEVCDDDALNFSIRNLKSES
jgi:ferredoxin-type protein NapH